MYCEQTAEPGNANFRTRMHVDKYLRLTIFIQIVNVLDLHFQSQKFESSILWSTYAIISQTVREIRQTLQLPTHKKSHASFGWHIYIWRTFQRSTSRSYTFRLRISRKRWLVGQTLLLPTKMTSHTASSPFAHFTFNLGARSISRSRTFRLLISRKPCRIGHTLLLPTNRKSHVGFRWAYLHFKFIYSKGQLGSWNRVSPDILAVLSDLLLGFTETDSKLCSFCMRKSLWYYYYYRRVKTVCILTYYRRQLVNKFPSQISDLWNSKSCWCVHEETFSLSHYSVVKQSAFLTLLVLPRLTRFTQIYWL